MVRISPASICIPHGPLCIGNHEDFFFFLGGGAGRGRRVSCHQISPGFRSNHKYQWLKLIISISLGQWVLDGFFTTHPHAPYSTYLSRPVIGSNITGLKAYGVTHTILLSTHLFFPVIFLFHDLYFI